MALADRHARALAIAAEAGCDVLLATDPGTVWWLTGLACDIETGPSPFAPPPFAVVIPDEPVRLVVSLDETPAQAPPGVELVTYEGFTVGPIEGRASAHALLAPLLAGRRVASERGTGEPGDVREAVLAARAVKDADELALLRAALRATDAGQRRLREVAVPGVSELELLNEVREAIELAAGERTPLLADLVSGPRTAGIGGPPSLRELADGDLVLCDLAPRVGGVWGDSCSTIVVGGDPSAEQRRLHARVRAAFERALETARPGIRAGDLDAAVRGELDYPHHTGHGLGGSYHEQPRIVPDATTLLAPGMVIAVEPGRYEATLGMRLEHVLLVTEDGVEDLSTHSLEL